jgi:hypothetical protein
VFTVAINIDDTLLAPTSKHTKNICVGLTQKLLVSILNRD